MRFCVVCKKEKEDSEFYKRPDGRIRGRVCKSCEAEINLKKYYENHDESLKIRAAYRKKNREKIKQRAAIARKKYNHSAYSSEKMKEYRSKVTYAYVKSRLRARGMKNEDITPEVIESKRVLILIERLKNKIEEHGEKLCSECKKKKPVSEFYTRQWTWKGTKRFGIDNICKECSKIRNQRYKK